MNKCATLFPWQKQIRVTVYPRKERIRQPIVSTAAMPGGISASGALRSAIHCSIGPILRLSISSGGGSFTKLIISCS